MKLTLGKLLGDAASRLERLAEGRREAQMLLGHSLNVSRAWVLAHSEDPVDDTLTEQFLELVERRRAGEPIAYLTGRREFYGLDFMVTRDVLIPRPDTETLVDATLEKIAPDARVDVLDLGTGSGCVAIAIAHERKTTRVTAVDISEPALRVARQNACTLGVNVEFVRGDWFEAVPGRQFDVIVSNPPYVALGDPHLGHGDLRFEPSRALVSGADGLADIRHILGAAAPFLRAGGWLLFEHGHDQAASSIDLMADSGFCEILSRCDLAGVRRVAGGRLLTSKSRSR